jgi:hypothetical protein
MVFRFGRFANGRQELQMKILGRRRYVLKVTEDAIYVQMAIDFAIQLLLAFVWEVMDSEA